MKARNKMNAIEIDSWISTLRVDALTTHQIDEKSTELLHRLFEITEQIEPCGDDDMKVFRIHCERGTLEEYRDKYYEPEEDVDLEELKESFLKEYPEETVWYRFASKRFYREWNDTTFYGVFLNDEYILADGDVNAKGWPYDASELLLFLCDAAEQVVRELEDGSYHKIIEKELPYRYRYGKIRRKDYWDICPDKRKKFRDAIGEENIEKYLTFAKDFPDDHDWTASPDGAWKEMTARQFFEACATGYRALGVKERETFCFSESEEERARYGGTTPKEMYYSHADGRDEGLMDIPMDDPVIFEKWFNKKDGYREFGGHPWEVIPSMSISNSLHFSVCQNRETGLFYFDVSGDAFFRMADSIIFYLAVKEAGYPVMMYRGREIAERLMETDMIGIAPEYVNPFFLDGEIQLCDSGDPEAVIAKAEWDPEKPVRIKKNM